MNPQVHAQLDRQTIYPFYLDSWFAISIAVWADFNKANRPDFVKLPPSPWLVLLQLLTKYSIPYDTGPTYSTSYAQDGGFLQVGLGQTGCASACTH